MTTAVAKVVFDTNILLSGHFWKGPPYRCLLAAEAGLAVLVLSDPIVSELREKLTGDDDLQLFVVPPGAPAHDPIVAAIVVRRAGCATRALRPERQRPHRLQRMGVEEK